MKIRLLSLSILFSFYLTNTQAQVEVLVEHLHHAIDLAFYKDRAFIAIHGNQPHNGQIASFNINDPEGTYQVHFQDLSYYPRSLAVHNDILYIAFTNGISKIALNQPTYEMTKFLFALDSPTCLEVQGDMLYYGERDKISRVDLSHNLTPYILADNLTARPLSLAVKEEFLYIAMGEDIIKINTTDSEHELEEVYSELGWKPYSIAIVDNKLYLDKRNPGLQEIIGFHLDDPQNTVEVLLDQILNPIGITFYKGLFYFTSRNFSNQSQIVRTTTELITSTQQVEDNFTKIFPNPTSGALQIEGITSQDYYIRIYNNQGIEVLRYENQNQLDLASLPQGNYNIQIQEFPSMKQQTRRVVLIK